MFKAYVVMAYSLKGKSVCFLLHLEVNCNKPPPKEYSLFMHFIDSKIVKSAFFSALQTHNQVQKV